MQVWRSTFIVSSDQTHRPLMVLGTEVLIEADFQRNLSVLVESKITETHRPVVVIWLCSVHLLWKTDADCRRDSQAHTLWVHEPTLLKIIEQSQALSCNNHRRHCKFPTSSSASNTHATNTDPPPNASFSSLARRSRCQIFLKAAETWCWELVVVRKILNGRTMNTLNQWEGKSLFTSREFTESSDSQALTDPSGVWSCLLLLLFEAL